MQMQHLRSSGCCPFYPLPAVWGFSGFFFSGHPFLQLLPGENLWKPLILPKPTAVPQGQHMLLVIKGTLQVSELWTNFQECEYQAFDSTSTGWEYLTSLVTMRPTGCLDIVRKPTGCEAAQSSTGLTMPKEAFILSRIYNIVQNTRTKKPLKVYLFSWPLSDMLHGNTL